MFEKCRDLDKIYWPQKLNETPFPPEKLWIVGNMPNFQQKTLAIVGSRKFSSYGKLACEYIIEGLQGYPITIVSGLALGIDSIAHQKALECGLHCVAVPGSGLAPHTLYPPKNHRLAEKIIENGGCLISEFESEMPSLPWMFPQRNRIMAGLCDAVLIIEAEEKSGTLITARLALDYNREVFTIPHSIFSQTGTGPNDLLKNGAHLVTSAKDILEFFGFKTDEQIQKSFDFSDMTSEEILIIENLKNPQTVEELIFKIDLPAEKINQTISLLQIKNIIVRNENWIQLK
jgi:DNA processing protein